MLDSTLYLGHRVGEAEAVVEGEDVFKSCKKLVETGDGFSGVRWNLWWSLLVLRLAYGLLWLVVS